MKVVGLCGGSGSGKGVVSSIFSRRGIPAIDTDAIYHEITSMDSPCLRALVKEFGNEIISESSALNRKALAKIVFNSDDSLIKLKRLNEISHKFILDEVRHRLAEFEKQGYKAVIVDAPVLFESGFNRECDVVISVVDNRETRLERVMTRDNITMKSALSRISSQLSDEELISRSDVVIKNDSDLISLEKRVFEVADFILNN